ncbi:MAG: hypothetical protein U5K37_03775 [Natrialbaceae archaeon]|nr:hypothetical protein [Natrialbaceae archaeon]
MNTGESNGTQDIDLAVDDETVDTESRLSLEPGDSESVTLRWDADAPGMYTATVSSDNDSDSANFTVENATDGMNGLPDGDNVSDGVNGRTDGGQRD